MNPIAMAAKLGAGHRARTWGTPSINSPKTPEKPRARYASWMAGNWRFWKQVGGMVSAMFGAA